MKEKKSVKLSEKKKHLLMYLSLLAAAVFFAIQNPEGSWLPLGIGIGLAVAYGSDGIRWLKNRKVNGKTIPEQPDETDHEEEQNR